MGLEFTKSRVAVAIAKHPSYNNNSIYHLEHIKYRPRKDRIYNFHLRDAKKEVIFQEINKIATLEKVCGFVVGWPLEPSGFPGSRCGRVLNLLDYLTERRDKGTSCLVNPKSRPIVLWDERVFTHGQRKECDNPIDEWGRCQSFVGKDDMMLPRIPNVYPKRYSVKTSLRSDHPSTEDSSIAGSILEDFLDSHSNIFGITRKNPVTIETSTRNEFHQIVEQIERNGGNLINSSLV